MKNITHGNRNTRMVWLADFNSLLLQDGRCTFQPEWLLPNARLVRFTLIIGCARDNRTLPTFIYHFSRSAQFSLIFRLFIYFALSPRFYVYIHSSRVEVMRKHRGLKIAALEASRKAMHF